MLSNTISIGSIVKVNRLMKKTLQNFGVRLRSALGLLNSVARWCNTIFAKIVPFYLLMCMSVERILYRGALVNFSKSFSRGAKSGEICFTTQN